MRKPSLLCAVILLISISMTLPALAARYGMGMSINGQEVGISGKATCTFCSLANPGKTCRPGCCEN